MNTKNIGISVIGLLIGFGAGYMFHSPPASTQNTRAGFAGTNGTFNGTRGAAGGFLTGTVAAKDSQTLTLNTRDGSSHVVLLTPATSVSKNVTGGQSDVVIGATVMVSGTTNSDGSVSATLIQIRPASTTAPRN